MSVKTNRQRAIRRIIRDNEVGSQEELQALLRSDGFPTTQATLSRDFKELGIVKVHDYAKGYVNKLPGAPSPVLVTADRNTITTEGIRSIEFSNSFAVVKTHPGFASAVATIIDHNVSHEIVGTLAGDDTVLLILRDGCRREQVLSAISHFISGIQSKLI